jgi:hypothetical protein
MSLFVFSAFALSLLFAAVIGSWIGPRFTPCPLPSAPEASPSSPPRPGSSGVAAGPRPGRPRADVRWASEACAPSRSAAAIVRGPVAGFANRALLELLGLPDRGDEVVGLPFTNVLHPRDHERFAAMPAAPSDGGSPRGQDQALRLVREGRHLARLRQPVPSRLRPGQSSAAVQSGPARRRGTRGLRRGSGRGARPARSGVLQDRRARPPGLRQPRLGSA